jgi:hypothetical protein
MGGTTMRVDYGGAVIPWWESPIIGAVNYTWQERPPEAPVQDKSSWGQGGGGGGFFGGFFENLDDAVNTLPGGWALPIAVAVAVATGYVDPTLFATEAGTTALATEGALTAAEVATLTEASLAVDAAMAGAGGVGAGAGAAGAAGLTAAEMAALAESSAVVDPMMAGAGGINWGAVGQSALQGAGKGVSSNVLTSALTGREITPEGLAISAITGGAGGGAGNLAGQSGLGAIGSGAVSGGVGGTTGALLTDGDVGGALTRGAISGGIGGAGSSLVSGLDPATKAGVQSVASGLTNAAITGNTTNLLPNLIAGGLGSAGTTAAWNALTSDTVPTGGTQKAEIDALDPMTRQLADLLYNSDTPDPLGPDIYPTAANVSIMNSTEPTLDVQGRTSVPKIDNGYKFNEDTSTYTSPTGEELTYEQYYARTTPGELDSTLVDVAPEPIDNQPTSPLSPDSGQQTEAYGYYNNLISKGVEPSLASKLTGYSPGGSSTGVPGGSGGTNVLPVGPAPLTPSNPNLTAGELTVEGERPVDVAEVPPPAAEEEKIPTVTKPTGDVIKGTVTTPKTTVITPKTTGALPTASTPQASSGASVPSGTSQSGGIPTPISGQSLAAAPVYANTQILQQLKQLDPKLLSMIAPQLSGQAGALPLSPQIPQQATGGNMQQSNPYNTLFQTMLADKGGTNPSYGAPMFSAASSMLGYATGGGAKMDDYLTHIKKLRDKEQTGALMSSGLKLLGAPAYNTMGFKDGGHIPEFKTGTTGHYVKGAGDGQSDDIPAMLADGEYVFDADTVASLGNGSSDAGAQLLDHFREAAREHKRSAPVDKIPPKASPLAYMKEALKRHARG